MVGSTIRLPPWGGLLILGRLPRFRLEAHEPRCGHARLKITFDECVDFVLDREGGYVFDPNDPGGETNFGISKRAYPNEDIKNMTVERAKEIYRADYWNAVGSEGLPDSIRLAVFDTSVNCGVAFAKSIEWSGITLDDYLWRRIDHYLDIVHAHPDRVKFLAGWMRRCQLVREA